MVDRYNNPKDISVVFNEHLSDIIFLPFCESDPNAFGYGTVPTFPTGLRCWCYTTDLNHAIYDTVGVSKWPDSVSPAFGWNLDEGRICGDARSSRMRLMHVTDVGGVVSGVQQLDE